MRKGIKRRRFGSKEKNECREKSREEGIKEANEWRTEGGRRQERMK